ncbi:MAG: bacteriocin fulvocin C-related protein [Sphingomonadales bacterium]|jgi:hypothetical protein
MKNKISRIGLIIAAVVCIWACNKDLSEVQRNTDLNQKLEAIKNEEAQRMCYKAMTPKERLTIWQNHLHWAKDNLTLNPKQLEKMSELDAILNEQFFATTASTDAFEIWTATVTEVFNPRQIYLLFNQPFHFNEDLFIGTAGLENNSNAITQSNMLKDTLEVPECNCHYTYISVFPGPDITIGVNSCSVWSGSLRQCKRVWLCSDYDVGIYNPRICGRFWSEKCDGRCRWIWQGNVDI